MKAVKLCRDCGRPIKNATNFRVVCDECLRKKEAVRRDEVRSLESEDEARRAAEQGKKKMPFKSLDRCVREAAAMGISYGKYVSQGLDQPKRKEGRQ